VYKNKILKCFACSVLGLAALPGVAAEEPDLRSLLLGMTEARDAASTSGATKKLEGSMAAPAILKVFTQSDIERYDSVYELLRTVAGITIDDGNFGREYINIRNIQNGLYNNKVLLMINGFKITDPAGPHFFIETIPKESIKRLEIIKGPGSVLYGSNAFTGVINIETFDGFGL
jgi:iron complex outermembrane receptor protein